MNFSAGCFMDIGIVHMTEIVRTATHEEVNNGKIYAAYYFWCNA
jgi:hypothetical protein